jgi:phospholipid transport system transporter-binding protein
MRAAAIVAYDGSHFGVEGVLDFDSVVALVAEGERLFSGQGPLDVDLRGVREANSAGLALLLEWLDLARRRKLELRYRNLPESLVRLAELTNLGGLLPASDARA